MLLPTALVMVTDLTFQNYRIMKLSYKQKLFLYFCVIFSLFTIGIIVFAQSQEKNFRTEALEEKLDAYIDVTNMAYSRGQDLDSVASLLPAKIRLTLIDDKGFVKYDNAINDLSELENHAERPEIVNAKSVGKGANIRISTSNNVEYLYYVKHFNGYYIRAALPYDIKVQQFIKSDNIFLYYIVALFLLMLILINLIATRFGKSIKQLRDFAISSEDERIDANLKFQEDELGEISEKIVDNYKQLKANKKKIAQEREKLLQHVHSSEEGICFFSDTKQVAFYNGLFIQFLNIVSDNAKSEPTVIFSDASFKELHSFLAESKKESYFETQVEKQGRHFSLRANVFEDRSFEIILNDITKQKKTHLLKQEMTGNIAHELRTPVTSIRGYLETVLEKSLDVEKERQFLSKAYKQVIVLSELIQDMGLITKIEEAPNSFPLTSVHVGNVLEDLKNDLTIPLQEKGIEMTWIIDEMVVVKSNRNLLYSIFRNLTDNVIRYAGKDIKISISLYNEDKNFYYFIYSDTGIGISDEKHFNRLFERFYRINEGRTRDSGGSGLGLSIVKNALLLNRGSITVKNRQGGGLEFLIRLPKA